MCKHKERVRENIRCNAISTPPPPEYASEDNTAPKILSTKLDAQKTLQKYLFFIQQNKTKDKIIENTKINIS